MDLATVQAALADLERSMKRVGNKIKYREKVISDTEAELRKLKREHEDLVDKHIELGAVERRLTDDEDTDDDA